MHVLIMGCGRTGSLLAQKLVGDGHRVSIVDWEPAAFNRLPDSFAARTYLGNGVDHDVLLAAGIQDADVFVAATSGDNRNVMATQIAQDVFRVPRVVARIKDPIRADIYEDLGIQVDCRTCRGADQILALLGDS